MTLRGHVSGGHRAPLSLHAHEGVGAAGAADGQASVFLAVEVEEHATGESGAVDALGSLQTHLFGHGHEHLQRAVRHGGVLGDGHHGDDGDAVIGAQGGAVGREPLAVADELDTPFGRIVRAVRTALADHVDVTLEDHDRRRLSAGRRRYAHDQVRASGRHDLEPLLGGPCLDVRHGCFLVT